MTHVQRSRHIRWGYHNAVGFACTRWGKIAGLLPHLVPAIFQFRGVVCFFHALGGFIQNAGVLRQASFIVYLKIGKEASEQVRFCLWTGLEGLAQNRIDELRQLFAQTVGYLLEQCRFHFLKGRVQQLVSKIECA